MNESPQRFPSGRRAQITTDNPVEQPSSLPAYRRNMYIILAVLLLLTSIVGAILLTLPIHCNVDKSCFIIAANACEHAALTIVDDRGESYLETRECMITKEIVTLKGVTSELNAYLVGPTMTCTYRKGDAPYDIVTGVLSNAPGCDGELERRLQLIAAVV